MIRKKYPTWILVELGRYSALDMDLFDISLVGLTTIEQTIALLKEAYLYIGVEGGLVHLRQAVHGGTSVVLFGPTDPLVYGYEGNINLRGDGCQFPCEGFENSRWTTTCSNECKKACMWSLTPEIVMEEIEKYV